LLLLHRLNSNSPLVTQPFHHVPAHKPAIAARNALALTGFSAVVGQIVLMRELIVVFNGNEMSMGIMLATWLLWTATGSGLGSRMAFEERGTRRAVAALNCLLAFALPLSIWALRASKILFQAVPGELVGPVPMLLASLASLSLFCIVSGALFVAAARMGKLECGLSSRSAASSAYMFEALGSAVGGIAASIFFLRFLEPFQIAAVVAVLNLGMAAVLLLRHGRWQFVAIVITASLGLVPLLTLLAPTLERSAQTRLWQGFHLLASRDSIYGNLAAIETGSLRSIYSNGLLLANVPDPSAAEEGVHYALLEHPAPRRVLLIGGGINGSIAEALKHPTVKRIDYVELDPALIGFARQFIPAQVAAIATDSRVHVHYADSRHYLRATEDKFDAIILNLPDPQTAQLNRFYTVEFFRSARAHLAPGGLLALELRSSEETMSPDLADFLRCIQHTLDQVYPYTVAIPGDTIHFFAATEPAVLTDNPQALIARLRDRNLKTQYVREYFIPFRMMPDRMEQVREQLRPQPATPVNRDFTPVAYYFNIVLWSTQFNTGWSRWFRAAAQIPFTSLMAVALASLLLVAILLAFAPRHESRAPVAAITSVAATGFTLMALQIFLLLAFQSIYGYVYHQLAILIGLGMAGIAVGSWMAARRRGGNPRSTICALASTQILLALAAPALILTISLLARLTGPVTTWIAAQCVFPALAASSGVLGGCQFPNATAIYLDEDNSRRSLGALYAVDLLGGCAGALLLSTYLIPVFGFWRTAWLCAAINIAPALLAFRGSLAAKLSAT
jgi:spermidine synthase